LRKYLIAVIAALLSLALTAVAIGQGPATATLSVSPSKAGKKNKPKATKLKLSVTNQTPGTTVSRIDVLLPRFVRASGKGLKKCTASKALSNSCPAASKAGGGSADASINPKSPTPAPLRFKVTAYNGGTNLILFKLDQVDNETGKVLQGSGVHRVLKGKLSRASGVNFYQKIRIGIPDDVQHTAAGYSALNKLSTSIHLKKGNKSLVSTVGCPKSKQHVLGVVLTYAPNPDAPPRPSGSAEATAKCS